MFWATTFSLSAQFKEFVISDLEKVEVWIWIFLIIQMPGSLAENLRGLVVNIISLRKVIKSFSKSQWNKVFGNCFYHFLIKNLPGAMRLLATTLSLLFYLFFFNFWLNHFLSVPLWQGQAQLCIHVRGSIPHEMFFLREFSIWSGLRFYDPLAWRKTSCNEIHETCHSVAFYLVKNLIFWY